MTETRGTTAARGKVGRKKGGRTTPALFYRQVVAELRKVIWPTRKEMITYTGVVLTFVVILVGIVFGLDFLFQQGVLTIFG